MTHHDPGAPADARRGNWVDRLAPDPVKPYARLARWDRPMPIWLLFWPCAFAVALAALEEPARGIDPLMLVLFAVGSVLMRGAGCTFNDIVDRDIDTKVARTRLRPIPSGQVSVRQALGFMVAQSLIGFLVLIQFNAFTIWTGIASLGLIAIYPFMKRITWWPQFFLGLVFSWGALVGWTAVTGGLGWPALLLYAGSVAWVIGYDTIYALQDIEDDALVGVRSTARLFGARVRPMIGVFYALALALWLAAGLTAGGGVVLVAGLGGIGAVLFWQAATVDASVPDNPLVRFRSNHWVGLALSAVLVAEWALRL